MIRTLPQNWKKDFIVITLTMLGVIAAWMVVPEFRRAVGLMLISLEPLRTPVIPAAEASVPSGIDRKPTSAPRPYVGGIWRYDLTNKLCLIEQNGDQLKFYVDDPGLGQRQVGTGVVTEDGVQATIYVRSKDRKVSLKLHPSKQGKELEGNYAGSHADEQGTVRLIKIR